MKLNIKNRVNNFHGKKDKIIIFIDRYVNSSKIIPFRKSEILQSLKKRSFSHYKSEDLVKFRKAKLLQNLENPENSNIGKSRRYTVLKFFNFNITS